MRSTPHSNLQDRKGFPKVLRHLGDWDLETPQELSEQVWGGAPLALNRAVQQLARWTIQWQMDLLSQVFEPEVMEVDLPEKDQSSISAVLGLQLPQRW
ncbi:MAG: hypothetical protein AAEC03_11280 [Synechococcus sp.]